MTIIVDVHREARDKLLEHCDKLSNFLLGKLYRAMHMAEHVHKDQTRATGDRYVTHCYGVEWILVLLGFVLNIRMRIVALLHDTIEDCKSEDRKKLRRAIFWRFGPIVYLMVEALTRKDGKDYSKQLLWYIRWFWWLGLWAIAFVKLADILFNMTTIEGFGNLERELKQFDKARHVLDETIIPSRKYIPRRYLSAFDQILESVNTLLVVKREEALSREIQRNIQLRLTY